jgi:hypothetical protein
MKWFRRKKKDPKDRDASPRQRPPAEVKDLRARLTSDGFTLKH